MIQEILRAFILIFIAEMGDKTQILAMTFATKYPVKKVLLGIAIGSFLNHGLAVILGSLLSTIIPNNTIQMFAGVVFIFFALWSLKTESNEEDKNVNIKFGPVITVSLAFFLGELGDKTQLTAVTLAADANYPYLILIGTVAGMLATGSLGIFVGKKLSNKIPDLAIKLFASAIFLFFGIQKLLQTMPSKYIQVKYLLPTALLLASICYFMIHKLIQQKKAIQSEKDFS